MSMTSARCGCQPHRVVDATWAKFCICSFLSDRGPVHFAARTPLNRCCSSSRSSSTVWQACLGQRVVVAAVQILTPDCQCSAIVVHGHMSVVSYNHSAHVCNIVTTCLSLSGVPISLSECVALVMGWFGVLPLGACSDWLPLACRP